MKETSTKNESGILNARYGRWKGIRSLFTHRNPKNGKVWGEDLPVDSVNVGKWVPYDEVEWK